MMTLQDVVLTPRCAQLVQYIDMCLPTNLINDVIYSLLSLLCFHSAASLPIGLSSPHHV